MEPRLSGKHIIVGVTGSIAAYKAAYLVRLFVKSGAEVKVIMTRGATDFISPLTLATLSKNSVIHELVTADEWNNHVDLGLWADAMVVAPLTATTLSKLANGLANNMLVATYLSARCPVYLAPAMDVDMWHHPSTANNIEKVSSFGNKIIPVAHGELASGLIGDGRMAEPEDIITFMAEDLVSDLALQGKRIMITAGPTEEPMDPVRFIGNRSTGKMGLALAQRAVSLGAKVDLILGPTDLVVPDNIHVIPVVTASEMYEAAKSHFEQCDAAIMAAAVADYTPEVVSDKKIKKTGDQLEVRLKKTVDIAGALGKKKQNQILVGFALETDNEELHAKSKMQKKNLDFIVLNSLKDKGAGFGYDTNKVSIIYPDGKQKNYPLKSKHEVSADIMDSLIEVLKQHEEN